MSFAICTAEGVAPAHTPYELHAGSPRLEVSVVAIQGDDGYEITNRYSDGTIGVSNEDRLEAECDDEPMCAEHRTYIDHWEHA